MTKVGCADTCLFDIEQRRLRLRGNTRRRFTRLVHLPMVRFAYLCVVAGSAMPSSAAATDSPTHTRAQLRAASLRFAILPEAGTPTDSRTGATVDKVCGPLKTTITLLEDGETRVCTIATDFFVPFLANVSDLYRHTVAEDLQIPLSHVLIFSSHNHSAVRLADNGDLACYDPSEAWAEPRLRPVGEELLVQLRRHAGRLPGLLQPVTVWWAEGQEGRITYNRKGRRADGSTYLMREEDRILLGVDYSGDIDRQAPIVVLKSEKGQPIAVLVQFTGHPATSYHPEKPVVFGDFPLVACDMVAEHLSPAGDLPVSFLQGCAGEVNSKEMFRGGVERARQFGRMLGETYIETLRSLRPSRRSGLDYAVGRAHIPLAPLPPRETLLAELTEMDNFLRRARTGDENTLSCVGLNFPRDLTPAYRGALVEMVRPWNQWALELHMNGRVDSVPDHLGMEVYVLRLGDVGIVGMPCEPLQGIGRQIREGSKLPLTIPCGYTNQNYGYITDGPNTGDREYMSAFHRYTKFRPPLAKPAGDVLADKAVEVLNRFACEVKQSE